MQLEQSTPFHWTQSINGKYQFLGRSRWRLTHCVHRFTRVVWLTGVETMSLLCWYNLLSCNVHYHILCMDFLEYTRTWNIILSTSIFMCKTLFFTTNVKKYINTTNAATDSVCLANLKQHLKLCHPCCFGC